MARPRSAWAPHPAALAGTGGLGPAGPDRVRPSGPELPSVGPVTMTASFMILILLSQLNRRTPLKGLESQIVCSPHYFRSPTEGFHYDHTDVVIST